MPIKCRFAGRMILYAENELQLKMPIRRAENHKAPGDVSSAASYFILPQELTVLWRGLIKTKACENMSIVTYKA